MKWIPEPVALFAYAKNATEPLTTYVRRCNKNRYEVMGDVLIQKSDKVTADKTEAMFYGVGVSKFIVLSVLTWGLFDFYWFYKNFALYKKKIDDDSIPLARAIFSPIFAYYLFIAVNMRLEGKGYKKLLPAGSLAVAYFLLNLGGRFLPEALATLTSFLIFIPLLGANKQINLLNLDDNPNYFPDSKYTWVNWVFIVIGSIFTLLVILGLILEQVNT